MDLLIKNHDPHYGFSAGKSSSGHEGNWYKAGMTQGKWCLFGGVGSYSSGRTSQDKRMWQRFWRIQLMPWHSLSANLAEVAHAQDMFRLLSRGVLTLTASKNKPVILEGAGKSARIQHRATPSAGNWNLPFATGLCLCCVLLQALDCKETNGKMPHIVGVLAFKLYLLQIIL